MMNRVKIDKHSVIYIIMVYLLFLSLIGCNPNAGTDDDNAQDLTENQLLNNTYRIDIQSINVQYDFYPEAHYIDGVARLQFRMRPNQTKALFHFDPAYQNLALIQELKLDGNVLNHLDSSDLQRKSFSRSNQGSLEINREITDDQVHLLEISYRLEINDAYGRFFTDVNDITGNGNEELFPTINTPHELATHHITFNVHSDTPYFCIGSGQVSRSQARKNTVQRWYLDTRDSISSYTLMFLLVPEADIQYASQRINGVDVRIASHLGLQDIERSMAILETWLPKLEQHIGPFPMETGLSIFLNASGGGMEYYGATFTSEYALRHEIFHMYFGCSTVAKTYRDSWWDEAITTWYEESDLHIISPIPEGYQSNMVGARSPIGNGFDTDAYSFGAQMMQTIADRLGGRSEMIRFLSYLHSQYKFKPFNTIDLVNYLKDFSSIDMYDQFLKWLFNNNPDHLSRQNNTARTKKERVDMIPPDHIILKYQN